MSKQEIHTLQDIDLSPEDIAPLMEPYGPEDCMAAIKHGFAIGLQEMKLLPSEFESMMKLGNPMQWLVDAAEGYGALTGTAIGVGALGGAYSGYLRHRAEKAIEGKNDPEITSIQEKIRAYNEMARDLKRTTAVTSPAAPVPA